jgi:hypothetical protein
VEKTDDDDHEEKATTDDASPADEQAIGLEAPFFAIEAGEGKTDRPLVGARSPSVPVSNNRETVQEDRQAGESSQREAGEVYVVRAQH